MKPVRPSALSMTTFLAALVVAAAAAAPAWGSRRRTSQGGPDGPGQRAASVQRAEVRLRDRAVPRVRQAVPRECRAFRGQYGLAMSLLEAPQRDYKAISEC